MYITNFNIKKDLPILNKDIDKKSEDGIYIGSYNFIKSNNVIKAISDNEMKMLLKRCINEK